MNFLGLKIANKYGLVVLTATAIGAECIFTGYGAVGRVRNKVFSKKFMEENFKEIHTREVGSELPPLGYPDMGNGRYSDKLSYKEWFEFNNAQRAHYNFVEQVGIVIPVTLVAGIGFPLIASGLGSSYAVGRLLYTLGYSSKEGPKTVSYTHLTLPTIYSV
eukprot:TRINITY_DN9747_c0_g1_i1.p1 TRINITY_DN9747_c0_g1~~TRINITY_DN9747_c0_g1_i1.p1  ORF type:complete len:161 (+),score=35.82 TRINITY_DN9747_c0_g1_i1:122-604(+)